MIQEELNTPEQLNSSSKFKNENESKVVNSSGNDGYYKSQYSSEKSYTGKRSEKTRFEKFLTKPILSKDDFFLSSHSKKITKASDKVNLVLDKLLPIIGSLILIGGLVIFINKYKNDLSSLISNIIQLSGYVNTSHNIKLFNLNIYSFYIVPVIILSLTLFVRQIKTNTKLILAYFSIVLLFIIHNFIFIKNPTFISPIINVILLLLVISIYCILSIIMNNKWFGCIAYIFSFFNWIIFSHYILQLYEWQIYTILFLTNISFIYITVKKDWELIIYPIFALSAFYILIKIVKLWLGGFTYYFDIPLIIFIILSYVLISIPILISILKSSKVLRLRNFILLLCITFTFFLEGFLILYKLSGLQYYSLFSLVFGIYNMFFLFILYKSEIIENTVIFLFLSILFIIFSITFIAHDYRIFILCCLASVSLLKLSKIYKYKQFVMSSIYTLFTSMLIIFFFWIHKVIIPFLKNDSSFINFQFLQVSVMCLFSITTLNLNLKLFIFRKRFFAKEQGYIFFRIKVKDYRKILRWLIIISLYISLFCLIYFIFIHYLDVNFKFNGEWWYTYTAIFTILLFYYAKIIKPKFENYAGLICIISTLFYPLIVHTTNTILRNDFILAGFPLGYFLYHYVNLFITFIIFYLSYHNLNTKFNNESVLKQVLLFYISCFFVFVALTEFDSITLLSKYSSNAKITDILEVNSYFGYSLILVLFSFLYIAIGIKRNIFVLRIVSLCLFIICTLKFLLYDISSIPHELEKSKMEILLLLGISILIFLFGYSKARHYLKKVIAEAKSKNTQYSHTKRRIKHKNLSDSWKNETFSEVRHHRHKHHSGRSHH